MAKGEGAVKRAGGAVGFELQVATVAEVRPIPTVTIGYREQLQYVFPAVELAVFIAVIEDQQLTEPDLFRTAKGVAGAERNGLASHHRRAAGIMQGTEQLVDGLRLLVALQGRGEGGYCRGEHDAADQQAHHQLDQRLAVHPFHGSSFLARAVGEQ